MAGEIGRRYGPAHYPNIYMAAKRLEEMGVIRMEPEGKSVLISLDWGNPLSTYYISEIESQRAQRLAGRLARIADGILGLGARFGAVSICALEPERHSRLNRIELLILASGRRGFREMVEPLLKMESMRDTRIDPIILTAAEFAGIMLGSELNPLKDLILDRVVLYNGDGFWETVREHRISARYRRLGKGPNELNAAELAHNYARFGYRLSGAERPADDISIEPTVFSMSISAEARIRYGAVVIAHKNMGGISLPMLYYLFKRYGELGRLRAILSALAELGDGGKTIDAMLKILPGGIGAAFDRQALNRYMELYG